MGRREQREADELSRRADNMLRLAAEDEGVPLDKYLREAGIMSDNEERKVRRHEVRLADD